MIFAISLLGTLVLSACGGGENPTTVTTGSTTQTSTSTPTTSTETPHVHTENEYGFCSICGEYLHEDRTLDLDNSSITVGALKAGGKFFFRWHAEYNHHDIALEDSDDVTDAELKGYALINQALVEVDVKSKDLSTTATTPDELGPDKMVYLVVTAAKDYPETASIYMSEYHAYNEAGVCHGEGSFIQGMISTANDGSMGGIHYDADSKKVYYRYSSSTLAGHEFNLKASGDLNAADVKTYYVDAQYIAHELGENVVVPEGVGSIYAVITHTHVCGTGGFKFEISKHVNAEHGFCPDCEEALGTELVYDIATAPIALEEVNYFYFEFEAQFTLRLYCDEAIFDEDDPKAALSLYVYNIYGGFKEVPFEYDDAYQADFTVTDPGDFYLFVQLEALEDDLTVALTMTHQ